MRPQKFILSFSHKILDICGAQVVLRCKQADEQRRKRDDTAEVYASFASEKVKKMPAVKNGFKIEIFNVPTS